VEKWLEARKAIQVSLRMTGEEKEISSSSRMYEIKKGY